MAALAAAIEDRLGIITPVVPKRQLKRRQYRRTQS
jgi:hypothetical protein